MNLVDYRDGQMVGEVALCCSKCWSDWNEQGGSFVFWCSATCHLGWVRVCHYGQCMHETNPIQFGDQDTTNLSSHTIKIILFYEFSFLLPSFSIATDHCCQRCSVLLNNTAMWMIGTQTWGLNLAQLKRRVQGWSRCLLCWPRTEQ